MERGKRFVLSAEQKSDVWCRWKLGQTLLPLAKYIPPFGVWYRVTVGLFQQYGGVRPLRSRRGSARKSLADWLPVRRSMRLPNIVAGKLILDWSPKQISGWLKTKYPDDESMRVSHETIYRSLFIQARGALKKELLGHLRSKRRIRRSQHSRIFKDRRGQIGSHAFLEGNVIQHSARWCNRRRWFASVQQ